MTMNYNCEFAPGVRTLELKAKLTGQVFIFFDSVFLSVNWK